MSPMTEAVRKLRDDKYPFIVDMDREKYNGLEMEILSVDSVSGVIAPKRVCIKCGGMRHGADTRGFCPACKLEMGMPTYKPRTQLLAQKDWEAKRQQLAQPANGEVAVDSSLVDFAWEALTETDRTTVLCAMWATLPLAEKARLIQAQIKRSRELVQFQEVEVEGRRS